MSLTRRRSLLCGLTFLSLCLLVIPLSYGVDGSGNAGPSYQTKVDKLIIHEWGTFTNFSGSNGVQLEFRPLLDGELPAFVFDRAIQSRNPFGKSLYIARQRMETPVTYFYTDRPRDVDVKVAFPKGLLTEFYPPVTQMAPVFNPNAPAKLQDSLLDWGRIRLLPQADFDALQFVDANGNVTRPSLPAVEGDNHYAYARETDSAVVQKHASWHGAHYEKFLFYRGLGSFSLPIELRALGEGRFRVTNSGQEAVRSLFLVHVAGQRIQFTYHPALEAGRSVTLAQSSTTSTSQGLGAAVVADLLETGLYEKEARAMVKTWQSSWFGEEGTRMFYILPQSQTDELLPLTVSPAPDEVVRVLVGRMEVLTPEQSRRLTATLAGAGTCASAANEPMKGELARLGRFAEPALAALEQSEADPQLRGQLAALLDELRERREARPLK